MLLLQWVHGRICHVPVGVCSPNVLLQAASSRGDRIWSVTHGWVAGWVGGWRVLVAMFSMAAEQAGVQVGVVGLLLFSLEVVVVVGALLLVRCQPGGRSSWVTTPLPTAASASVECNIHTVS